MDETSDGTLAHSKAVRGMAEALNRTLLQLT